MFFSSRNALAKAREIGVAEGRSLQRTEDTSRRADFQSQELAWYLGKPVIIVPNEWSNPVVGFGKELMQVGISQVLVVENYLTQEDVWCGGVRMDFSEQRLDICLTLDPYQLWAITAHNSVGFEDFDKPKSGERWSKEHVLATLEANGFFKRWEAFKARQAQEA